MTSTTTQKARRVAFGLVCLVAVLTHPFDATCTTQALAQRRPVAAAGQEA